MKNAHLWKIVTENTVNGNLVNWTKEKAYEHFLLLKSGHMQIFETRDFKSAIELLNFHRNAEFSTVGNTTLNEEELDCCLYAITECYALAEKNVRDALENI